MTLAKITSAQQALLSRAGIPEASDTEGDAVTVAAEGSDELAVQYSSPESVRSAISLMNYITRIWTVEVQKSGLQVWDKYKVPDIEGDSSEIWQKLVDFWREDWQSCQWVLQEAVLSKKLIIFYREGIVFSLDATMEFFEVAKSNVPPKPLRHGVLAGMYNKVLWTTPINTFTLLRKHIKNEQASPEESNEVDHQLQLLELLAMCRRNHVTDGRDKIYAVLGLTDDPVAQGIEPSYNKDRIVSKTFIDVAIRIAGNNQLLHLLEFAGIGELDVPSWVPDWSKQYRSQLRGHLYNATGQQECSPTVLEGQNTLKIRHAKVGKVTHVSPAWRFYDHGIHDTEGFIKPLLPMVSRSGETVEFPPFRDEDVRCCLWQMSSSFVTDVHIYNFNIYNEDIEQATARTLCADTDWSGQRTGLSDLALQSSLEAFNAFRTFYAQGPDDDGSHLKPGSVIRYRVSGIFHWILNCSAEEAQQLMYKLWPFAMAFQDAARGQRFAVLDNGLIGLVPGNTEKGEVVCVFDGGRMPFVLRHGSEPDADFFLFIGDAYIHGVMGGELFQSSLNAVSDCKDKKRPSSAVRLGSLPEINWQEVEIH